jgi:hypothetical protein
MFWDYIKNSRKSQMNDQNTNSSVKKDSFDLILKSEIKKKLPKINLIKEFFCQEKAQVDTLILLIISAKREYPFGIKLDKIIQDLHDVERYYLFKNNPYVLSVLNTLALPAIGILFIQQLDGAFDLTQFGLDYYHETQRM